MKKYIGIVVAVILVICTFVSYGIYRKTMYEADLKNVVTFINNFDTLTDENVEAYGKAVTQAAAAVEMKSKEGKALMKDFEELGNIMSEYGKAITEVDEVKIEELANKRDELTGKMDTDSKAFGTAAEKSGVSKEIIAELKY